MKQSNKSLKWVLTVLTAALLGLSLIDAPYPDDQILQHILSVLFLGCLSWAAHRDRLSLTAFMNLCLFLCLHILGARYLYTFVPYDDWCQNFLGFSPDEYFEWPRNQYDRFVHGCFGLLFVPALREFTARAAKLNLAQSLVAALAIINGLSGLYEVVEWIVTLVMSQEEATNYNGQQGDFWDAQKDMALAFLGSLAAALAVYLRELMRAAK